jgi:hypothetical protein
MGVRETDGARIDVRVNRQATRGSLPVSVQSSPHARVAVSCESTVRARTMHNAFSMTHPEPVLFETRKTDRRAIVASHQPTDHDPAAHRHPVDLEATVRVSGGELRARGCRLSSLSLGGALVEIERLPIGTLVNLSFRVPSSDERLSLDAIVHWCTDNSVSVLFDSLRAWEVWVLWRFFASLDEDADSEVTRPTLLVDPSVMRR